MTLYSPRQLAVLLMSHGFSPNAAVVGIAIIEKESGGESTSTNHNRNGSTDRGIWQWNNRAHADISDACAYNPDCATQQAFAISQNGSNWGPWNPPNYTNGIPAAAIPFLPIAKAAVLSVGSNPTTTSKVFPPCTNGDAIHYLSTLIQKNPNRYQLQHDRPKDPVEIAHNKKVITAAAAAMMTHYGPSAVSCVRGALRDFYTQDSGGTIGYGFFSQLDLLSLIAGPPGTIGVGGAGIPGITNPLGALGSGGIFNNPVGGAIAGLVNLIGAFFKGSTWIRAAEIVGGMILIVAAIIMVSKDLGLSSAEEIAKKYPNATRAATSVASGGTKVASMTRELARGKSQVTKSE